MSLLEQTGDPTKSTDFYDNDRQDIEMLQPGDQINAWEGNVLISSGLVDLTAPDLGIIWIRQFGLGERKLILCLDYDLHRGPTGQWDLHVEEGQE
ncbi:hypothetical protein [Paenarthrobacter nitroguajacolicus]|uniref:hypothetical protein n=1 Tax=Paenarthrobacter nitroguajacolicus TaxID=211146 RepID=UPI00342BE5C6